jgi:hypothetical protein
MKGLVLRSVLALSGSMGVFAASVEQSTNTSSVSLSQYIDRATTDSTQFHSEIWTPLIPIPTEIPLPSNHSSLSYSVSFREHKSGDDNVKTKTKTITEDYSATDDVERSTTVVMVPSTQVYEYHPTITKTITHVEVVMTKSLHKPKHTKHHWTETETEVETETEIVESPSSTTLESSKTHTKHHKSKHHTESSKKHSSETVETPLPTSSVSVTQSSSESSVQEVVVVTTEDVQVVTTGYEEVVSTITLSEGDSRLSTLTKASPTGSSSVTSSKTLGPHSRVDTEWLSSVLESSTILFPPPMMPHTLLFEASSTETSSVTSSGASELFSHYNPEVVSTVDPSVYTSMMSKIRSRHTPVTEASSTESSSVTSSKASELFSQFNPEVVSTIDSSVYTELMSKFRGPTETPSTETSSVTSSKASDLFSHFNPEYSSVETPLSEPTLLPPPHETWPFILPQGPVTPSADNTTTRTRSGHKTKEPPSIFPVEALTNIMFTVIHPDHTITITTAPEFRTTEISSADEVAETLFARDNGDPRKKYDKYRKPDKAMSKRMSRWSKHHSHAEEKNWSRHTKYQVKSLEEQMEYDESSWSKHHKTTLAAVLPAAMQSASADAMVARNAAAAAADDDDDDDDPEKDYEKKMRKASKEFNKVKSKADAKWFKQLSKEMKESSKKREKSLAKQQKADDKSSKKAFKSRMKEQGDDEGEEAYVAFADVEERALTTPARAPAQVTVTATVTTVVGGAQNGTFSTSWRKHHASKTASLKTSLTTGVGGGN